MILRCAFIGKMRAGKSTACELLVNALKPDEVHLLKFADPIYQCLPIFRQEKKHRLFMQKVGDAARLSLGDDIFERIFSQRYFEIEHRVTSQDTMLRPEQQDRVLILCDDVRFLGEYDLVKTLGFLTVGIYANELTRRERDPGTWGDNRHRSETELDKLVPDIFVANEGSLDELRARMGDAARQLYEFSAEKNRGGQLNARPA